MDVEIKKSIVNVGGGRGFVVERGRYKYIITAAHCLPELPPAHGAAYLEEKTYGNLVGPIGSGQTITVECLFVDPVSDIAILGEPDGQELYEQSEQYLEFTDAITPIAIREAKPGEEIWALSLDGVFRSKTITNIINHRTLRLSPGLIFKSGMSGSPVLGDDGCAVSLVNLGDNMGDQHCLSLSAHLPCWFMEAWSPER